MSPDSVEAAADLGARMVSFSQRRWDDQKVAHDLTCCFRYAGLPYELAEGSMKLFAEQVLPVVQAPALSARR